MTSGATIRRPAVAGSFYPAEPEALAELLDRCFVDRRGPGRAPARGLAPDRRIRAAIVPHAGYTYSGPIAAHAFAAIAAERPPSEIVLLGVNHRGRGAPAALSDQDWQTPLGLVPTETELLAALRRRPLEVDRSAHAPEHSIEVELPFLQCVLPEPRIVALSVSFGPLSFLAELGAIVGRAIRGRDVLLLASSDFSHYVPAAEAERKDRRAIEPILSLDAPELYERVTGEEISMCGIAPVTALLTALEGEALEPRLLRWGHSGEAEMMREVVGYASILFESASPIGRAE